jgi:dephospho-CoA kinase
VLAVGITGGIGAGKSALADLWVAKGAILIDADVIAREVVEPGSPTLAALVDRFGSGILSSEGTLDRQALADVAFADPENVSALNDIMHPVIGAVMNQRREEAETLDKICLYAIPLLKEDHRTALKLDVVVVVDCPIDIAVERLIAQRNFTEEDARARINAQMTREERNALADDVVVNDGDRASLEVQADALWDHLVTRQRAHG